MAEFYVSLGQREIASQIADMINQHNKWYKHFSADTIMMSSARYFVDVIAGRVVGCASQVQDFPEMSKVQHICVLPEYRKLGIGKKLTCAAIDSCNTEYVYMTIREDNIASLSMAQSLNFAYVNKRWFKDHWTLIFGRRK